MRLRLYLLAISFYFVCHQKVSADHQDKQRVLYTILHEMALPRINDDPNRPVTERFILLMPGQVLNYYDYCPYSKLDGAEIDAIPHTELPPDENMFMLSDKLPTTNPLGGGQTQKSLSTIYRNILYSIDTTAPDNKRSMNTDGYKNAMKFLQEEVSDPKDPGAAKLPRFELYHRYEMKYYDTVALVKKALNGNRTLLNGKPGDYETWYHENYRNLKAHMSGAYSEWLINGQKSQVEDNVAVVDIESARKQIEDARRVLQNEELPSMDGGSTYYPVHFTPSNWYEYLIASDGKPTREQLQSKITNLKMRLLQLESMLEANESPTREELETLTKNQEITKARESITDAAKALKCYEYLCQAERNNKKLKDDDSCKKKYPGKDPCGQIAKQKEEMETATVKLTRAQMDQDIMTNTLEAYSETNDNFKGLADRLKAQISDLTKKRDATPIEAPIIDKAKGKGEMTREEMEKNWMMFHYNSEKSDQSVNKESTTYKTALSFKASGLLWSAGGGSSYSHSSESFKQKMSSASVSVSAKLLRVTINRNWFRPSVFQMSNYLKMQDGITSVSPGPKTDEKTFVNIAEEYQLPEYTTGFLLAKEVSLTFLDLDSSTSSEAVQTSATAELSGSYGPFKASASFGYGHSSSDLRVSSQSDGLHIEIPGAQIIGYYTAVLPRFPNQDPGER